MAVTADRRPPARSPGSALPPPPAQQLPPRASSWGRQATAWVATGVAGFGAAPLCDHPGLAVPVLGAGVLAGTARGVCGVRTRTRNQLADRLVEALSPALGLRVPDRRAVRLYCWRRGWPGVPRRVELHYAPGIDDTDPLWVPAVVAAVGRRLLADYEVRAHDRRRCRISLRWVPPGPEAEPPPAAQVRAERTIGELLGPTAAVTGVRWEHGELAAVDVRHEAATKLSAAGYRHRVERVVSTMLPGRWRAQWDLEGDTVRFELRPTLPQQVPHPPPVVTAENRWNVPLAVDEDGETVTWHLRGTGPHLLVIGKTGQGKTVLMNGVVMELAFRGWPVWICDPKRIEFLGMRGWPNVQVVSTTVPDQVVVIWQAWAEMERRYARIESGAASEDDFEPLILVLDEYRDFYAIVAEWYAGIKVTGMPTRCPVLEKLGSLVRKGRSARVHVILGLQRPDADVLGGEMRDNFGTRISLGPLSPQGAMMMWESPHLGVALPRGIAGRATAVSDDARPLEVQAYWTPDPRRAAAARHPADLALLERLKPAAARHPRLRVRLDEELLTTPDAKGRSQEWAAVAGGQLVPAAEQQADSATADTGPLPRLVLAGEPAAAPATEPGAVPVGAGDEDDEELDVDEQICVDELAPGDLVCVEERPPTWALVESVEPDVTDEDLVCIDWRGDDDAAGSLVVHEDAMLTVRRWPTESAPTSHPFGPGR